MGRLLKLVPAGLVALYPLIVLFGIQRFELHYLGFFLIALALLRLVALRGERNQQALNLALSLVMILVVAYVLFSGNPDWLRFYPVLVNTTMLVVFGWSLVHGIPMIERMARVTEPDLPERAVPYARKVTVMWCTFFLVNGLVALYTARWTSFEVWAWYNGAFAYALMAALFAGEWLVRQRMRRRLDA
ncbi:MAG: hypothetical protein HKN19_11510 [Halioglobus sp.]|nr:hypothetical protein [Halioglobus sp.]